jgi:hypothetical protein
VEAIRKRSLNFAKHSGRLIDSLLDNDVDANVIVTTYPVQVNAVLTQKFVGWFGEAGGRDPAFYEPIDVDEPIYDGLMNLIDVEYLKNALKLMPKGKSGGPSYTPKELFRDRIHRKDTRLLK